MEDHLDACTDCEQYATSIHLFSPHELQAIRSGYAAEPECSDVVNQVLSGLELPLSAVALRRQKQGTYVGLRIRDYHLTALLGRGGMGAVYRAEHTVLRKEVAIKILPRQAGDDPSAVARFQREMQAVGRLDHRHIVRALDAGEVDGINFLAMDLIEGVDLSELTRGRLRFPVEESCELVRQLAEGLAYVHSQGLIHRDVKPSNVMISQEADGEIRVRILDLGLALLPDCDSANAPLTSESQLVGTLEYMAPEQTETTEDLDHRVDIYSLGVTLYRLLTGSIPFRGRDLKSPARRLRALTTRDPESVSTRVEGLPAALVNLVDSMIARNPDDRPQTMTGVLSVLNQFAPPERLRHMPAGTPTKPPAHTSDVSEDTAPTVCSTRRGEAATVASVRGVVHKLLVAFVVLAGIAGMWWIRNDGGYLRVESVAGVDVRLQLVDARTGESVQTLTVRAEQATFWIDSGDYRVAVSPPTDDQLVLDKQEVRMVRRGDDVVRVSRRSDSSFDTAADAAPRHTAVTSGPSNVQHFPWQWETPQPLAGGLNTEWQDDQATVSADGRILIFHSSCVSRQAGQGDCDLWMARRPSLQADWGACENLGDAVNSPQRETGPCYHAATRTLIFSSNRDGGVGEQDLWMTVHTPDFSTWSPPVNLGPQINSPFDDGGTAISTDGLRLIFASARPAQTDGVNLWMTRRKSTTDGWQVPVELAALNSDFLDADPSLSSDGRVLMFTSTRPGGFGQRDLWVATRDHWAAAWSEPTNAGADINTTASESHACLLPGGRELIFASRRDAGVGGDDLWTTGRCQNGSPPTVSTTDSAPPEPAIVPFSAERAAERQQAWADYLGVAVRYENSIGLTLQLVPAGRFEMGPHEQEHLQAMRSRREPRPSRMNMGFESELIASERPTRSVDLPQAFYLGTTEVRERDYEEVIGIRPPMRSRGEDLPVGMVSWLRAARFCNELSLREGMPPRYEIDGKTVRLLPQSHGYRLPTEAEWEFACRAGSAARYPWGEEASRLDAFAWADLPPAETIHKSFAVAQKSANAFGLYDMLGNHWEWCEDAYGPPQPPRRIARGGFVLSIPIDLRAARRRRHLAHMPYPHAGFRVVLTLPPTTRADARTPEATAGTFSAPSTQHPAPSTQHPAPSREP